MKDPHTRTHRCTHFLSFLWEVNTLFRLLRKGINGKFRKRPFLIPNRVHGPCKYPCVLYISLTHIGFLPKICHLVQAEDVTEHFINSHVMWSPVKWNQPSKSWHFAIFKIAASLAVKLQVYLCKQIWSTNAIEVLWKFFFFRERIWLLINKNALKRFSLFIFESFCDHWKGSLFLSNTYFQK